MIILKTYKQKLQLTLAQILKSKKYAGCCRSIYNLGLRQRQLAYEICRQSLNYYDQANELKDLKRAFPYFREVPSQCLQMALKDLEHSFKNFFKKTHGYPQYRCKSKFQSFTFPQHIGKPNRLNKNHGMISLPKLGNIKFRWTRELSHLDISEATIKYDGDGWYICLTGQEDFIPSQTPSSGSIIALDRGITHNLASSEGEFYDLPQKRILTSETKIAQLQRWLSAKKKNSIRSRKLQRRINKLYRRNTRIRQDWLHKTSHYPVNNHNFIILEDLDVAKMARSRKGTIEHPGKNVTSKSRLNRKILRQGWGYLAQFCHYKSRWRQGEVLQENPYLTSQRCCLCQYAHKNNRQSGVFRCQKCDFQIQADINAALNLLLMGLQKLYDRGHPLKYFKMSLAVGLTVIARGGTLMYQKVSMKREPLSFDSELLAQRSS